VATIGALLSVSPVDGTDRRSNNFDVLRLLAAWSVLFSHSYPTGGLKVGDPFSRIVGIDTLGGVGVAIFFVLSGYLVTRSWQSSAGMGSFLWKRARRIYPALIVCVLLCTLLMGPLVTTLDMATYFNHPLTRDYLRTASAWSIHYPLPGVFVGNPVPNAVNGSLWSLPYEIRCYCALALIGMLPFALRWKVLLIAALLACMLLIREPAPPANPFDHRFGLDYYMVKLGLFFAVGATYQCWVSRLNPIWWVGAMGAVIACALPNSALRNLIWVLSFSTLVLGIALGVSWLPKLPSFMGDWSYGLYLYAFPVQQLLAHYGAVESVGFVGYTALCSVAAMACAGVSWFLIERPALQIDGPFGRTQSLR
jgi:peptidoglycan/LPS O-acetylase OafA/YrhL